MRKRVVQVFAMCFVALVMMGADSSSTRVEKIGHNLVCQCGCSQILMECNHVGCPVSPVMIAELHSQAASNSTESGVLKFFINKYGPIVLAAPMRGGFDNVAWVVPIAALFLCLVGVMVLMGIWRRRAVASKFSHSESVPEDGFQARIRRETDQDWSSE